MQFKASADNRTGARIYGQGALFRRTSLIVNAVFFEEYVPIPQEIDNNGIHTL